MFVLLVALFGAAVPVGSARAQETPKPIEGGAPPAERPPAAAPAPIDGASPRRPAKVPGEDIKVTILTFGPGTHPFFKFGHNAIWISDPSRKEPRTNLVYNWGMFSFADPALLPKFVLGRFMYWMEPQSYRGTVMGYKREGRSIDAQELDLDPATKLELVRRLEENATDEFKYYKYDYYRDNCSTRVRDMINVISYGAVKAASEAPARLNYREQTSRLTADLAWEYVALNLVMGDLIDQPRTKWEESFIPMEFQKVLRDVKIVGADGAERPIVKSEYRILEPTLTPPREDPPTTWPYALLAGLVLGGGLFGLGHFSRRAPARIALGVLTSFFGLLFGFFGWFFLAAWSFTDHEVGYRNENVLLCVPWAIVLTGTGIRVAFGRTRSALFGETLTRYALTSAIVATVAKVLPWFDQDNTMFLVFFVPFWAGMFYAMKHAAKHLGERVLAAVPAVAKKPATAAPVAPAAEEDDVV